jgi:hypothetical protein
MLDKPIEKSKEIFYCPYLKFFIGNLVNFYLPELAVSRKIGELSAVRPDRIGTICHF